VTPGASSSALLSQGIESDGARKLNRKKQKKNSTGRERREAVASSGHNVLRTILMRLSSRFDDISQKRKKPLPRRFKPAPRDCAGGCACLGPPWLVCTSEKEAVWKWGGKKKKRRRTTPCGHSTLFSLGRGLRGRREGKKKKLPRDLTEAHRLFLSPRHPKKKDRNEKKKGSPLVECHATCCQTL